MARSITGSEAFVEALRLEGVEYICGIVGSAFMDPLDLFPAGGIRFIQVRHEQSAALMAEGYARATGKPGVCIGQNGPGITNLVTGVASAALNHTPLVVITPAVLSGAIGSQAFQEVDQMRLLAPLVKWQFQVNRPERMAEGIRGAFRAAVALRGPVQVDIPRDAWYGQWEEAEQLPATYRTDGRYGGAPDDEIAKAARLLAGAKRPFIVAGLGAVESDAGADIAKLAEALGAPMGCVYMHNDAVPGSHPLAVGPIGYQGSEAAMKLMAKADVVLALGTRLNTFGTTPQYGIDFFPKQAHLIHNSINPLELGSLRPMAVGLIGDCRAVARQLIESLKQHAIVADRAKVMADVQAEKQAWARRHEEMSTSTNPTIHPRRALWEVAKATPAGTSIVADVGNVSGAANSYFASFDRARSFFGAGSLGGIGVALPTALGVSLARPDQPVLTLVGDGAWSMCLQEVMTAVTEKLSFVSVIFNNSQYGAEKRNQFDFFGERYYFTNLENPNFADIAKGMGAWAIRVTKPEDIGPAMAEAFGIRRAAVVEIVVDSKILSEPYRRDALRQPQRVLEKYTA
ncbi:MAG: sulfoacetaldehyde acetyltransferase [Gemmatimonadales bacterium]|nr:sulfoacetaldehyde acetyltransferase [Gemmatimonadales bacterium]